MVNYRGYSSTSAAKYSRGALWQRPLLPRFLFFLGECPGNFLQGTRPWQRLGIRLTTCCWIRASAPVGADHGDKPVKLLERRHVRDMMAAEANTPTAANNLLSLILMLMHFAVEEDWRKDDPTLGIKKLKITSGGFHCWMDDELEAFERRWPIGFRRG